MEGNSRRATQQINRPAGTFLGILPVKKVKFSLDEIQKAKFVNDMKPNESDDGWRNSATWRKKLFCE